MENNDNEKKQPVTMDTKGFYGTPRSTITLLEADGRFCKLAIQRAVWRLHQYRYAGYDPYEDHQA